MNASLIAFLGASRAALQAEAPAPDYGPRLTVREARGFVARARGLIARPRPAPGCGLLLRGTNAVHGFGMQYPIDLIFLDRNGVILECRHLKPAGMAACRQAHAVLEMRSGEVERLGLRPGMHPGLMRAEQIFEPQAGTPPKPSRFFAAARAVCLIGATLHPSSHGAPFRQAGPDEHSVAGLALRPGPLSLASPLAPRTLQHLEDEAEALYREAPDGRRDAELLRLYETLAELGPHRSPHAWLRIGNIHHRAGSIGLAMEAYRRASARPIKGAGADRPDLGKRPTADADAPLGVPERKALLNLAGLALEQARQSLDRLASRPVPDDSAGAQPSDGTQGARGMTDVAASGDSHRRRLESLARVLSQQHASQDQQLRPQRPEDPLPADGARAAPRQTPYMVERYTASGRRNAVKAAKGSLHAHPADELPAPQVVKPRSRPTDELLPSVEYLLGDPQRGIKADAKPTGKRPHDESSGGAAARRSGH